MKTLLMLSVVLAGCLDSNDPAANPSDAPDRSVVAACGRPPQIPQWDAVQKDGAPGTVLITVTANQLDARMAWEAAIESWARCADTTQ